MQGYEPMFTMRRGCSRLALCRARRANAKVMVEDTDFEKAQNLMVEWEATDPDISAALVRCPAMQLFKYRISTDDSKFMTPALVGVLARSNHSQGVLLPGLSFTWSKPEERTIGRLWHRFFPGSESGTGAS